MHRFVSPRIAGSLLTGLLLTAAPPVVFAAPERELTTDRPDVTESPFTVEPGYMQLEMSLAEVTRDSTTDERRTEWALAPLNLRVGVTPNAEVQFMFDPWRKVQVRDRASGVRDSVSGRGDFTLRSKVNFWGNNGEGSAFALMPFITFPVGANGIRADGVEGGLILPYSTPIGGGWSLSVMSETDVLRNEQDDGYRFEFLHTASFGHDIAGDLGAFVELTAAAGHGAPQWTSNAGVTYGVTSELQLDAGVLLGLNGAADDMTVFMGLARRF